VGQVEYFVSRNAGHAYDLDDGRTVSAGDVIKADSAKNRNLIDEGVLVKVPEKKGSGAPEPTEAAVREASDSGVNLAEVKGTGGPNNDQVTVEDVKAAAEKKKEDD